ncbi:MAG: HepT-like ribonuclease domain-containing protein [Bacteroidota bacterium]
MSEKDKGNLLAILDSCTKIQSFVDKLESADSLYNDVKTFDAVLMNFLIIGESVAKLSEELKNQENQVPWTKIKGFRNIVAHNYLGVDAEEVWQIVKNHLPVLERDINKILGDQEL